jgi:hypothetical protein
MSTQSTSELITNYLASERSRAISEATREQLRRFTRVPLQLVSDALQTDDEVHDFCVEIDLATGRTKEQQS